MGIRRSLPGNKAAGTWSSLFPSSAKIINDGVISPLHIHLQCLIIQARGDTFTFFLVIAYRTMSVRSFHGD
jgi:hypothetical protein